ncbi:MAG TPA: hypothetical protein RMH85_20165 [Polyangiaceae bacterium LLY-WYZ-15_(1-7)]|nr:hypothetical protein [Polyangiaceae bacterium LLY-WYZ-15_(1-7)]HJL10799.1 hypothetical protein [Polyangiaceae bacterium LLY-WYZ-15_(1-7)]HJL39179.1 hypothetical protein [Polyangiaceae bacterium LLY-WYZ-15_(1-7)]
MTSARALLALSLLSHLFIIACGDDDGGGGDAGSEEATDAGARLDAGVPDASAAVDAGVDTDASPADAGETTTDAGAEGLALDALVPSVADATCAGLFRCCDPSSLARYLAPFREDTRLDDELRARIPAAGALEAEACPALLEEIFAAMPIGRWREELEGGHAGYDADAAGACLETLSEAECGEPFRAALFDPTCFATQPPAGGEERRRWVEREGGLGDDCRTVADGFGGLFFGTCDPARFFCCAPTEGETFDCQPFPGAGREGRCIAAGQVGDACETGFRVCATGLDCDSETGTCVAPADGPLELGEACVSESFSLLGECEGGWCDILGSRVCEPVKENGEACGGSAECASGVCEGEPATCGEPTFCEP